MEQTVRDYSPRRDRQAARLLWKESGWITDEKAHHAALDMLAAALPASVLFSTPPELLSLLDERVRLEKPEPDWDY